MDPGIGERRRRDTGRRSSEAARHGSAARCYIGGAIVTIETLIQHRVSELLARRGVEGPIAETIARRIYQSIEEDLLKAIEEFITHSITDRLVVGSLTGICQSYLAEFRAQRLPTNPASGPEDASSPPSV